VYCDGSEAEHQRMIAEMLARGGFLRLNEKPTQIVICIVAVRMMWHGPSI